MTPAFSASPPTSTSSEVSTRFSLFVVWCALFCDYCLLTIAVPIFPQLGKSDFLTGFLFSTKAMLQVLSAPIVARYIDSYNLEPLIGGLMIEALSTLVFAFTENYTAWCIARAVSGISSSMIISSGFLHIQVRHRGATLARGTTQRNALERARCQESDSKALRKLPFQNDRLGTIS